MSMPGGRVCRLAANESPLGPSPKVVAAIASELEQLHRYPAKQDDDFREALAAHFGRGLTAAHFFTACSGYEVLDLIARALLRRGDEAIICPPTFSVYAPTARLQEATIVEVPLDTTSFAHDLAAILAAVTPRTRIVYACNPGNPTGAIMTAAELTSLLEALPAHVTVVADEVYFQYVDRPDFPDSIAHVLTGRPVVVVHSFSKAYGLAGLRLGYALAPPALARRMAGYRREFHLSRLDLAAGLAALADQDHVQRTVAVARESKQYLYGELTRLGLTFWPSEANFVLVRPPGDGDAVQQALAGKGVRVRPTRSNGLPGCLRVTTGLPDENRRFVEALTEVIGGAAVDLSKGLPR